MRQHPAVLWITFTAVITFLLALDLATLSRRSRALSTRGALAWSAALVALALLFGLLLLARKGPTAAFEYYAGYLIELTLSVDNLFVFILLFHYFGVPPAFQGKVLKWGILGAIVMRGIMIAAGALLLQRFSWIIWVFGGVLLVTGVRMFRGHAEDVHPERNPLVRMVRRFVPLTKRYDRRGRFFLRSPGGWVATPLLLVVLVVEWTDLVFAVDSIPAIFAVTRDPFIVYTSNIFAILGLRALYFVLGHALDTFRYLKPGVALVLIFVGLKMVLSEWIHLSAAISLLVIAGILGTAVLMGRKLDAGQSS